MKEEPEEYFDESEIEQDQATSFVQPAKKRRNVSTLSYWRGSVIAPTFELIIQPLILG